MATVYLQPGTGTGSGTASDPYYYSELGSAETAAGDGGTILFTEGTYTFSSDQTWDSGGFSNMTYKSEEDFKAKLQGSGNVRELIISGGTSVTIEGFSCEDIAYDPSTSVIVTFSKLRQIDSGSNGHDANGLIYGNDNSATYTHVVTNCSFSLNYTAAGRLFLRLTATFTNCSFHLRCSAVTTGGVTGYINNNTYKNCIFSSDNNSAINTSALDIADTTNCCIDNFNHTSGGTDNIFADPQFVDPSTGDLRLRPTSPCIGAATTS
jgi:hypothetical protein